MEITTITDKQGQIVTIKRFFFSRGWIVETSVDRAVLSHRYYDTADDARKAQEWAYRCSTRYLTD